MHLGAGGHGAGVNTKLLPEEQLGTLVLGLGQTSPRIPLRRCRRARVLLVSDRGNWSLPTAEGQAPYTHLDPHPPGRI